ncbi:uncharacterized protein LOC127454544 [Myxocyprinus asiaticus]|uniref:uncharacterized protein LOC127454544 n=1 Tax=Myxocyprinus asiaticus TaxID=70543 RepID=UPI0022226A69|nr:uncharacterized protein LOC127454544 [Myxocyprinus asiaticus]
MPLTVAKGEGITVLTVTSNPKSKWPLLCQILGTLCYSPVYSVVCSVSQDMKGKLSSQTALGIVQIIVGVINLVVGILFATFGLEYYIMMFRGPFWLGGMFLAFGIVCILATKFPCPCLLVIAVILNIVSAALAITAVVLYSVDLASDHWLQCGPYFSSDYRNPPSPQMQETCLHYLQHSLIIIKGLDIMMIVFSVLQICMTVSFCILTGKALRKKSGGAKSVEDAQIHNPLLEEAIANPEFSAVLAITAVVLCSVDMAVGNDNYCAESYSYYDNRGMLVHKQKEENEVCLYYKYLNQMNLRGLDIMLIVFSVLQLCVTISFCILMGKALCKKGGDAKKTHNFISLSWMRSLPILHVKKTRYKAKNTYRIYIVI